MGVFGNSAGVFVSANNNVVAGNLIGTDGTGTMPLGNLYYGIAVNGDGNRIGTNGDNTSDGAERNVISGSGYSGLSITGSNNRVAGNLIGTDATGMAAIPNAQSSNVGLSSCLLGPVITSSVPTAMELLTTPNAT